MDYPFIVQAWIYQGDYRPSPPRPPFLPSTPGAAQRCTLPPHRTASHRTEPPAAPTPFPGRGAASVPSLLCPEHPGSGGKWSHTHPHPPRRVQADKKQDRERCGGGRAPGPEWVQHPWGMGGISPQMSRPPFFPPLLCIARCPFPEWG